MREYEALIDQLIPQTQRTIRIFDRSLSRAYNSPQRFEALRQFLLASRANRLHDRRCTKPRPSSATVRA